MKNGTANKFRDKAIHRIRVKGYWSANARKNYIYKYHFNDVAISRTKSEVDKPTDQNITPCKQSGSVAEVTNESRSKANKSFEWLEFSHNRELCMVDNNVGWICYSVK